SLLAQVQVASDTSLNVPPSAKRTSKQAIRPAGFAGTLAGLFSATTARTLVPGLSRCERLSNCLPAFQSPLAPSVSPFSRAENQSSADTRSLARSMVLPAGSTKVRRQNRFATGASWAGLPSGNQIHWQPS